LASGKSDLRKKPAAKRLQSQECAGLLKRLAAQQKDRHRDGDELSFFMPAKKFRAGPARLI